MSKGIMEKGKSAVGAVKDKVAGWLGLRKKFKTPNGEQHQLYFQQGTATNQLMVASNPMTLRNFVTSIQFPSNRPPRGDVAQDRQLAIQYLNRVEELTHTPPGAIPEDSRISQIQTLLQVISETVARLMAVAGGGVRSSKPSVFAGTYGDFARGMRVEIVDRPATQGSDASADEPQWRQLVRRRETSGSNSRSYYVRGHLLSQYLGGDGGTWLNLTPITQAANQDHERRIELPLKRRIDAHADHAFIYVVNPSYGRSVNNTTLNTINSQAGTTPSQKQIATDLVRAEQYVPTSLVCTIHEIDPITGEEVPSDISGTHTVNNPIDQTITSYHIRP